MAHKTYVLDTSVVVHDPSCFDKFVDNDVIIPVVVLEELDHLKIRSDATGANARAVIRYIDKLTEQGNIREGVDIGGNTIVKVDGVKKQDPRFDAGGKDDNILACAASFENSILVSKDVAMRIRAKSCDIEAQDYLNDKVSINELFVGYQDFNFDETGEFIEDFTENGLDNTEGTSFEALMPNEFAHVIHNGVQSIFRKHSDGTMKPVRIPTEIWGLRSKNMEQAFALDLLLDPKVPLVTLIGKAGSGKTLLATASALEQVINRKAFQKAEFYKPVMPVGKDIGFLPGSVEEKLGPWMGSIRDSLEYLTGGTSDFESFMYQYRNRITMEALTYVRGRSLNGIYILVDECQNLTKNEIKTLITRVGFGSKIILTGDIEQIDNHYLDAMDNGLTYVIEKFKKSPLAGHVTLVRGERSALASEASRIL